MTSLVAWVRVTHRRHLRVVEVDVDRHPEIAEELDVRHVPSLVLLDRGTVVGRLDGPATGRQIDELISRAAPFGSGSASLSQDGARRP
jgi:thioredoxin-like negative regulator of GroEL